MHCIKTIRSNGVVMSVDICKMLGYCELEQAQIHKAPA